MKKDNSGSKNIDQRNERIHQEEKPQVVVEEEEEEINKEESDTVMNDGGVDYVEEVGEELDGGEDDDGVLENYSKRENEGEIEEGTGKRRRINELKHRMIQRISTSMGKKVGDESNRKDTHTIVEDVFKSNERNFSYANEKSNVKEMDSVLTSNNPLIFPPKPLDATQIIKTLMKMEKCSPHEADDTGKERWENLYDDVDFYDDVHDSKWLDKNIVIAARRLDIYFSENGSLRTST